MKTEHHGRDAPKKNTREILSDVLTISGVGIFAGGIGILFGIGAAAITIGAALIAAGWLVWKGGDAR